ncbi:hypothetical protein ACWEOE_35660 [Amycolatopsis sp. NPDC004368]
MPSTPASLRAPSSSVTCSGVRAAAPAGTNTAQGLPVDSRSYGVGAQILADHGLDIVARVTLPTTATPHNLRYLRTKQQRLGHTLDVDQSTG